jgi:hypothetical protein
MREALENWVKDTQNPFRRGWGRIGDTGVRRNVNRGSSRFLRWRFPGKKTGPERTDLLVQAVDRQRARSGSDHQPPEERSPDEPLPVQGIGGGSSERLLGSDRLEYEKMGGGLRNLRGKTGRNLLDPINREKRIHENPSHFNLTLDFIGAIFKHRVFQRELII